MLTRGILLSKLKTSIN